MIGLTHKYKMENLNQYYKSIPSEQMSDFEDFYLKIANVLPDDCRIAELGLADGRSVILLASAMKALKKRCRIFAIDNMDYGKGNQATTIFNNIIRSGNDTIELIMESSLDASCRFEDRFFDFVFIDSSHQYEPTKAEIRLWSHKIKIGGILAGHNYKGIEAEKRAVDELIPADQLSTFETSYNHGVWYTRITE